MKKNKLLVPAIAIGAIASAITPLACLVGCNDKKPVNQGTIPVEYLNIDENNILRGFKPGVYLDGYDTLFIPNTVKEIGIAAFYDSSACRSSIPDSVVKLEFEKTPDPENPEHYIFGQLSQIGSCAFYRSPFKKVNLPWGLRKIGSFAFSESKVEDCYFPSFLNYIGEQAFSNTNLFSVMFNNEFEDYNHDIHNCPPWMREEETGIIEESCVKYVGIKAFFNCKNLITHRVTPYMSAYQLDTDESYGLQGPFTQYDDSTSSIVQSKLRIFDFTKVSIDATDSLDPGKEKGDNIFGTTWPWEEEPEENHFVLINTSYMDLKEGKKQKIEEECNYLNKISDIFYGPVYTINDFKDPYFDPPAKLDNWYIGSENDWNFYLDTNNFDKLWTNPQISLFVNREPQGGENELLSFYDNSGETSLKTFANDVKVNAELVDEEQEYESPKLSWNVCVENVGGVIKPKLVITALEPLDKWDDYDFHYRVTFSSKEFGREYTYGKKYRFYYYNHDVKKGYWALAEDDNPIEICIC